MFTNQRTKQMDTINYTIRPLRTDETCLLRDFLYEAIYIPEGVEPPSKEVVDLPELKVYIEDFGKKKDDCCLVAEYNSKAIGAVWTRIMNDYGHVDDETPSLAISLKPEYRGQGLGTALLGALLQKLGELGYRQASLSVQKANYAVKLYEKAGFRVLEDKGEEYIMVCPLSET